MYDNGDPKAAGAEWRSGGDLLDRIGSCEREIAAAQARQLALIAEFARSRPAELGEQLRAGASEFAVDELAAELRLSRAAAGERLCLAVDLAERLPGTAIALAAGDLDLPRTRAIADVTASLDPPIVQAVEARVLQHATAQTVGQLRAALQRAVLAVDPAGAQLRHERAVGGRRVAVSALPDGMAELWALLPAAAATAVYTAIDVHARRPGFPADIPTDARRADALVELVTRRAAAPCVTPTRAGSTGDIATGELPSTAAPTGRVPLAPLVQVTVAATTLLRLDDQPGELAGHGPIPAEVAREIAADASGTWRRILTDPATGAVQHISHRSYRPPRPLARFVSARDATCRFPGCRHPARRCDLDHVTPWPAGRTTAANLISLCRRHHRLKHAGRWTVRAHVDGTVTWAAPTGRSYSTRPAPIAEPAAHAGTGVIRLCRPAAATADASRASPAPPPPAGSGSGGGGA